MLDSAFRQWLDANAENIDQGQCDPHLVLAHIAESQLLRIGVDPALGGAGGDVTEAVEAIAAIASRSLAAAFVCWGQRAFIEYLLQSPNRPCANACCQRCSRVSWPAPQGFPMP
jgi:alkylation response protein AidB-like acyl-CoA dehydrogenase